MRALIDTIFGPVLGWLTNIYNYLSEISVPLSRPLPINDYFGAITVLGPYWRTFITTTCFLAFIYGVVYLITNYQGLFVKFKNSVKWW